MRMCKKDKKRIDLFLEKIQNKRVLTIFQKFIEFNADVKEINK